MDDSAEDQRKPHMTDPPQFVSLEDLKKLGVLYFEVHCRSNDMCSCWLAYLFSMCPLQTICVFFEFSYGVHVCWNTRWWDCQLSISNDDIYLAAFQTGGGGGDCYANMYGLDGTVFSFIWHLCTNSVFEIMTYRIAWQSEKNPLNYWFVNFWLCNNLFISGCVIICWFLAV